MKDKLVSYNSCVSIFQPDSKRSYGTVSPLSIISGPNVSMLYFCAGSVLYTSLPSIAFGTIDRLRRDFSDPKPLNRDQWVLWSTGTATCVRVLETKKSEISEHWSRNVPKDLQTDSPSWVNDFVDEMLRR